MKIHIQSTASHMEETLGSTLPSKIEKMHPEFSPTTYPSAIAPQMKSSSEPIWKQHRRMKEEQEKGSGGGGGGGTSDSATPGKAVAVGAPAGASTGGNRESEIQTGRKLTQRLAKAGVEDKFNKEEVLEILHKVRKRARSDKW